MKTYCKILKAVLAVALCFSLAMPVEAVVRRQHRPGSSVGIVKEKNMKNSFKTPDFAYPQDVAKNAQAEYDKALAAGDGLNSLRAAIQMNIAETSIDAEGDVSKSLARYEELGTRLPVPWNSLAYLLQGRLYTEIYQNDSWSFDNRKLPLDSYPENIQEWSGAMFAARSLQAVRDAMHAIDGHGTLPLQEISGLLVNYEGARAAGMTVGDFVRLYSADILGDYCGNISDEPLRFGNDPQSATSDQQCFSMRKAIYDLGLKQSEAAGNVAMASLFAYQKYENISYAPLKRKFLSECFEKYGNTAWGARFVAAYARDIQDVTRPDGKSKDDAEMNADRRKALQILEDYSKKYPTAPGGTSIPSQIAELRTPRVRISMPDYILPVTEVECAIEAENAYDLKLLIYRLSDQAEDNVRLSEMLSNGKLVRTVPVTMQGSTPDEVRDTIMLQGLKPGNYAILPSIDGTFGSVIRDKSDRYESASLFQVTDMSFFTASDQKCNSLFIVDAVNQQPLAGVKVHMMEQSYNGKGKTWDFVTDKNGRVEMPDKYLIFRATRGESFVSNQIYGRGTSTSRSSRALFKGQVLTDLSIYKPGQEVGFVGILGLKEGQRLSEVKRREVVFTLIDANRQQVDSIQARTDDWGRASGQFRLPTDGLLGRYWIKMAVKDAPRLNQMINDAVFNVADYKSPTFRVVTEKVGSRFTLGDTLNVKGRALTYSGMPVAGGKVAYTVCYTPWRFWWWYGGGSSAQVSGFTQTGADGGFDIELPTETIRGTAYEKGVFTMTVTVTDQAGETHEADPVRFSFASAYSIDAAMPSMICVDDSGQSTGSVKVTDMVGAPVEKDIYYVVRDDKGVDVLKGECRPGKLQLDLAKLESGCYSILFALNPEMKSDAECNVATDETVIWRKSDKTPAINTPLWVPVTDYVARPGEKTLEIPVGSSYDDSYIYCRIDDGDMMTRSEWIKVSDGIVKVKADAPEPLQRVYVHLIGMREFDSRSVRVTIVPEVQREQVEVATESFRDKMAPGDEETWKFRFTIGGRPMVQRPVMAVMSNKALNALEPFRWNLDIPNCISWGSVVNLNGFKPGVCTNSFQQNVRVKNGFKQMFDVPGIYTYDESLYGARVMYDLMYGCETAAPLALEAADDAPAAGTVMRSQSRGGAKMMAKHVKNEMKDVAEEEVADAGEEEPGNEEVRPVEMPLAFFMPDLLTDGDGVATVNFLVPNFNGTWQFQIAGYTPDLKGAVDVHDAVAAKQVMVQMNAPRFLRTGDRAQVSATLFNNSDGLLPVAGRIEILDADGNVLKTQEFPAEELNASGQRTVTVDYAVPADLSEVQIRAYAAGGRHRDGEGLTVAVLPSSTPVIDSKTFYSGPGQQTIKVELPKNAKDATVTLQYCGNPVWECVTALPSILKPESTSILEQVRALYGNAIAQGLIKNYPQIAQALKTFSAPENAGDSTLVSNLQKNRQLKAVTLNSTPWVNNANDETRRMRSLVEYLDTSKSYEAIAAIMKVLKERQNNDGGWSWCPDMPTSTYITGRVLLHFAMLKGMGYLPDGAEAMADKAFGYMDSELAEDWEKAQRRYFSVSSMLNYLYVKSFFPSVGDAKTFLPLRKAALKAIEEGWKDFDIYDKATTVTLEHRLKNHALAASILESLRQFAKVTPGKGMCFENLKGVFSGWNPLITTAQVLEAYSEAAPRDAAVDQLRQWLLMSKQTQDWGAMNSTAEVVQALLSTGSDWTVASDVAKVMAGGKELEVPARARITDSFTLTLTPQQVRKGDIKILKASAGPAWGGVVSQYVAPILDVKSEGVPQLRIEKQVYSIDGGKAVAGNLKVGDRVRVTLSITTDRDMDYVAVIDNRSACLEPADQLSGYAASDGIWMYREVRNTQTNLFIPFLPKGTSVINYECFVDRAGEYTLGIAQAQSQYAPVISAHSAGVRLTVK